MYSWSSQQVACSFDNMNWKHKVLVLMLSLSCENSKTANSFPRSKQSSICRFQFWRVLKCTIGWFSDNRGVLNVTVFPQIFKFTFHAASSSWHVVTDPRNPDSAYHPPGSGCTISATLFWLQHTAKWSYLWHRLHCFPFAKQWSRAIVGYILYICLVLVPCDDCSLYHDPIACVHDLCIC